MKQLYFILTISLVFFAQTIWAQKTVTDHPEISILQPELKDGFAIVKNKIVKIVIKVTDRDKIVKVSANGTQGEMKSKNIYAISLPLIIGNNVVRIVALDLKGNLSSNTFLIRRLVQNNEVEKRLALVIGNAEYSGGGSLDNPVNDAQSMKLALENVGFDVIKYENCSQKSMKKAIDEFGLKLKGYDVGLFFYAGHGVQVNGNNYLIPTDAKLTSENDVEYDCVNAGRILAKMEDAETYTNIVILDACRNNPFERSWKRNANGTGLAFMNAPKGSIIAYSTSPGSTASDGYRTNSLYTSALLENIKTPNITIEEFFKKVRKTVREKSLEKQIPWESTSLESNFYFKK